MSRADSRLNEQCNLLPPAFHQNFRIRQSVYGWVSIATLFSMILVGSTVDAYCKRLQSRRVLRQLATNASPLMELQKSTIALRSENARRQTWCSLVEAVEPDDCAVQTLGAIAKASQIDSLLIDSLHLRLPLEAAVTDANRSVQPDSHPIVHVTARFQSGADLSWDDRLQASDRIANVSLQRRPDAGKLSGLTRGSGNWLPIQLTATPQSTRVLP